MRWLKGIRDALLWGFVFVLLWGGSVNLTDLVLTGGETMAARSKAFNECGPDCDIAATRFVAMTISMAFVLVVRDAWRNLMKDEEDRP